MAFWLVCGGALVGLVLTAWVDDDFAILGLVAGAALGWIAWRQRLLGQRLAALEAALRVAGAVSDADAGKAATEPPRTQVEGAGPRAPRDEHTAASPPSHREGVEGEQTPPGEGPPADWTHTAPSSPVGGPPAPAAPEPMAALLLAPPRQTSRPSFFDVARGWLTEGNVPVKVGMLVLLAGVAALLRYASTEGWLRLPIELRLAAVALTGMGGLAFGFRERIRRRSFGLSLQGGAVGILVLTIFAAFRLYGLLPAAGAFALLVLLVAGTGFLAVLQDSIALAVLGVVAGFLAPILVSTGSANHVALFAWYAILDLAIFGVAWFRSWRLLNLAGFAFTFAIAAAWGVLRYEPAQFATTEPFLAFFFLVYLAIPILGARREPRPWVEGAIVFGNPLLTLGLQAVLLRGEPLPLALSALAMAAIYVAPAAVIVKRGGARLLGESFAVLALGFATLAVPLAFDAKATAGTFALEGAALVWLGTRQDRRGALRLALPGGLLLQAIAGIAFLVGLQRSHGVPVLNGVFLSGLWLVVGGLAGAWAAWRAGARRVAAVLFLWAIGWWTIDGLHEIASFVPILRRPDSWLAFAALSAWLVAEIHRASRERLVAWAAAAFLATTPLLALIQGIANPEPWRFAALAALAAGALRALACLRTARRPELALAHAGWLWAATVAAAMLLERLAARWALGDGWRLAAQALPLLIGAALTLRRPGALAPPLRDRFGSYRRAFGATQAAALALFAFASLWSAGGAAPLPYLPLFNPLDLSAACALVILGAWLRQDAPAARASLAPLLLGAAAFALITASTLRATHHLAAIPWDADLVGATSAQAALSVVWSVLGVGAWIAGSRRRSRPLWLAGAILMAVVLGKLAIVDRQHLGNLAGIVSFLAFGILCTVVGYLAPAPPRSEPDPSP